MSEGTNAMHQLLDEVRSALQRAMHGDLTMSEGDELVGRITRKLHEADPDVTLFADAAPDVQFAEAPAMMPEPDEDVGAGVPDAPADDALPVGEAVVQHASAWFGEGHVTAMLNGSGLANPKGDRATERLWEAIAVDRRAASSGAYERGYAAGYKAAADKNCRLLRQRLEVVTAEHERLREKYHAMQELPARVAAAEKRADDAIAVDMAIMLDEGLASIAHERVRQVGEEGWSAEHDDAHPAGTLARAGAAYAMPRTFRHMILGSGVSNVLARLWPFDTERWKPTPDDRERELAKAGALIAAEIGALRRARRKANEASGTGPEVAK